MQEGIDVVNGYKIKRQDKNFFRIRDNNLFGKVRNRMVDWFSEFF